MSNQFKPRLLHACLALAGLLALPTVSLADPASQQDTTDTSYLLLAPVVVTATRTEQNSFDLPVSIDAVDTETIHDGRGLVHLSEIASRIPGVVANNRNNLAQDLSVSTRGFGARSAFGVRGIRLYSDGIPLTMPDGQGQTGTFNLDTAKSIEFMRGPFSALYGNSSGGVVQIFTADGDKTPTVSGGVQFGSFNTKRENLTFGGQAGEVNYIVNAAHFSTDGFRDHSSGTRDTLNGKFTFKPSNDTKITVVATALDQPETQDPLGLTLANFKLNPNAAGTNAVTRNTRLDRTHVQTGITLDQTISDSNSVHITSYMGTRENLQYLTTNVSGIDRKFWGIDARWTFKNELAGQPFSLTAGMDYNNMEDNRKGYGLNGTLIGAITRNETQSLYNFDQYVQATWEPTDRWLLTGGLRHTLVNFDVADHFLGNGDQSGSVEYTNTSPVFGATFHLTPTINLYANVGKGFETPTFIEINYATTTPLTGPNLALRPSTSRNYEVGVKAFVADNTRVNAAVFKIDTENEIVTASGTGGTAAYKNAGDTERHGLEVSLDSVLPHNFNFYAAYTMMSAEFKDPFTCVATNAWCTGTQTIQSGNKISGTYAHTAYAELSWKHTATGFSTALETIHFGRTYTNDMNTESADPYTVFNLRGGFTQQIKNWRLGEFVRLDNMFDKVYAGSIRVNDSNLAYYEAGTPRSWTLGLNASCSF